MSRNVGIAMAMVAMTAMPGAASAREVTGYHAIAAGDWARAERTLLAELRTYPRRPELMLNLAAIYARDGRAADARALYASVLDRPEVAMDMPSGDVRSSHDLAQAGLGRAGTRMASAR